MKYLLIRYVTILLLITSSVLGSGIGSGTDINCATRTNKEALCAPSCSSDSDCDEEDECRCDGDCGASCVSTDTRCGRVPRVAHAKRKISGKNFGETVMYTCKEPYTLYGDDTIMCRAIGEWDRDVPKCELSCPDPGIPRKAKRRQRANKNNFFPVGTSLEYWCIPLYDRVSGNSTVTCQADGKWRGQPPKCQLKSCGIPDIPDNAVIIPAKNSYAIGERVSYKCETGFTLRGVRRRECRSEGWTSGHVFCSGKSCGDPGVPMNGKRNGLRFQYKSKVKFECHPGYILNGPEYLTCQSDQRWSGPLPTCRIVDCQRPLVPFNGQIDGVIVSTSLGSKVRFKCKKGYMLQGAQERECQADGKWSGENTKCTDFVCLRPEFNGVLIPDRQEYKLNSEVKFGCQGDTTLSGSSSALCSLNGETAAWNKQIPKCYSCRSQPIGFQNQKIKTEQLTQGKINFRYKLINKPNPDNARLHGSVSWCPYKLDDKYIQVDLVVKFTINAIATQGDPNEDRWVQYFLVRYSNDQKHWYTYQENGEDKVFVGNRSRSEVKINQFKEPFVARFVRIIPLCNIDGTSQCMRMELYGCVDPKECIKRGSTVWFQESKEGNKYYKGVISQINEDTVDIAHDFSHRVKNPITVMKNNPYAMYMDVILPLNDVKVGDKVITMWKNREWYYKAEVRDIQPPRAYNRQYDGDGAWTLPPDFRARTVHELQFCKEPRRSSKDP